MSATNPSNVPALPPPPGVVPNFVDPYSLSPAFVATAVLCLLFATAALIIRLATSLHRSNKKLRVEDYTCIIAWIGLIATVVLTVLEMAKGLGRHQWNVSLSNLGPISKLLYINRLWYSPTILAAKLTILLQLMRIFVPTKRGLVYWLIQTLIWLNVCFYAANVLSVIFQCHPVYKAWDTSVPGACVNTNLNLVVTGTLNVISDILILLLPLWTIWHLKMPIRAKLSVSVAFGAGIFGNLAGIIRLVYSILIIHGKDLTFLRLQHGMWTIAEITTALICASLPLVPQFIGLFRPKRPASRPLYMSGSKSHGRSESTGSLRRADSIELGAQSPRISPEPLRSGEGGEGGAGANVKEKQLAVKSAYPPSHAQTGMGWDERLPVGEDRIRKTVRIEQST